MPPKLAKRSRTGDLKHQHFTSYRIPDSTAGEWGVNAEHDAKPLIHLHQAFMFSSSLSICARTS
jgi:hypothetical protein